MEPPKPTNPEIDDRRVAALDRAALKDRRVASAARRSAPRTRTLKGARIVAPPGDDVPCVVRNISTSGARLEISTPIPHNAFDLVFDDDQWSRRSCSVVWRSDIAIGVKFHLVATPGLARLTEP